MEKTTCAICATLDNKIVTPEVRKNSFNQPQKHFNCRCVWVRIDRSSGGVPEAGDIGKEVEKIEKVVNSSKSELGLPKSITKQDAIDSAKLHPNNPNYLTSAEASFIRRFGDKFNIERIPNTRDGKPKNDFVIDGKEYELKSISNVGERTIRNRIFRATDKGKKNVILDIITDDKNSHKKALIQAKEFVENQNFNSKVDSLSIVIEDKIHKIK